MSRLKPIPVLLVLALAVMAPPVVAAPQVVRGDQFIEMMKDNTLPAKPPRAPLSTSISWRVEA